MPTLAKRIERFFLGEDRSDHQDAVINYHRAQILENTRVSRDNALVMKHMSEMIKLMADNHAEK